MRSLLLALSCSLPLSGMEFFFGKSDPSFSLKVRLFSNDNDAERKIWFAYLAENTLEVSEFFKNILVEKLKLEKFPKTIKFYAIKKIIIENRLTNLKINIESTRLLSIYKNVLTGLINKKYEDFFASSVLKDFLSLSEVDLNDNKYIKNIQIFPKENSPFLMNSNSRFS